MNAVLHALVCPIRSRWLRWRNHQPSWRDDNTAHTLGIAYFGCRRCGRGAVEVIAPAPRPSTDPTGETL